MGNLHIALASLLDLGLKESKKPIEAPPSALLRLDAPPTGGDVSVASAVANL